jgi:hypothetical protein
MRIFVNSDAYRELAARLGRTRPPEQPGDDAGFACWSALLEAESGLAGMVSGGSPRSADLLVLRQVVVELNPPSDSLAAWRSSLLVDLSAVLES